MSKRRILAASATVIAVAGLAAAGIASGTTLASARTATTVTARAGAPHSQIVYAPTSMLEAHAPAGAPCVLPDGSGSSLLHCYAPQDIRSAYGINNVAPLATGAPDYGQGQTIVLVDAYGSPTAASDLQHFHDTFFPNLPNPNFQQIYPLGNPQFPACNGAGRGQSGQCAAAGWSGEATLDIEWSYSVAPEAHIILLAVPPAETEGVQGFPNLFKAVSDEITALPAGTVFSMSFGATEQAFGGAGATQTAKFDAVFQQGLAKGDNFFASAGDSGSVGAAKQHEGNATDSFPTANWPASSPYVVSVGGTQLMSGWTWDPTSDDPSTAGYFHSTAGGDSQPVWNESYLNAATGGGASAIYSRPSWQANVDPGLGNARIVPDTAWNAAVNGGVDVYITAYPEVNCGNTTGCWTFFGGTSAASPQTAALVALANAARAASGKAPIGFLDPILYSGLGTSSAYTDVVPAHLGSAPATFAGSDVGVTGTVTKSVGDLEDNQLWESPVPGNQTTTGYDATTGWGTPNAPAFVAALLAHS